MRAVVEGQRPPTKFAETHMHTIRSDGRMTPMQVVDLAVAGERILTLAITDHEVIEPSVEARNYCEKAGYKLEVVVGGEFSTNNGHVIGLYLEDNIPTGKSAEWTIEQIHQQGGLAIAPHPMYRWTRSLTQGNLLAIVHSSNPEVYFDGFEVFSAGVNDNPHTHANTDALAFYTTLQEEEPELAWRLGAPLGCTDGHFYTVGRGLTGFDKNLREAIMRRETSAWALDVEEQAHILDLAWNMWGSMVLEPARRIQRYAMRQYREMNGGNNGRR